MKFFFISTAFNLIAWQTFIIRKLAVTTCPASAAEILKRIRRWNGYPAIVEMKGGSLEQSIAAASLALQNSLCIICDPIGNRVEAPCLGRNVMGATKAVSCANMALSDYENLVPLDEVIETMKAVGDQIHHALRCTNLGELSITNAAKKLKPCWKRYQVSFLRVVSPVPL